MKCEFTFYLLVIEPVAGRAALSRQPVGNISARSKAERARVRARDAASGEGTLGAAGAALLSLGASASTTP